MHVAMNRWRTLPESAKYLLAGGVNSLFAYLLFIALLAILGPFLRPLAGSSVRAVELLGTNWYLVVQWVAWVVGVQFSTFMMKVFVFHSSGPFLPQVAKSYFVYAPTQVFASGVLWVAVAVAHLTPQVGQLVAALLAALLTYFGHKYFTFAGQVEPGSRKSS